MITRSASGTVEVWDFFYDEAGRPFAVKVDGVMYYYITNLQGDVMQIVDANGATVATYEYGPYANYCRIMGAFGYSNPIRYRGYYFDTETRLYYLQSRYYDPAIGRFINADGLVSTGQGILGNNMFMYCNNDPVNLCDYVGTVPQKVCFPVCWGGNGKVPHMVTSTDGDEKSIALLEEVLEDYDISDYLFEGKNVYVHVKRDGIYNKCTNYVKDGILIVAGFAASRIPHPLAPAIGKGLEYFGVADYIFSSFEELPDGEYFQYSVTITWTTVDSPINNVSVINKHQIEMVYLWNDTHLNSPYWYLRKYEYGGESETLYG